MVEMGTESFSFNIVGHISFALIAISFWLRDILLLRIISVCACLAAIFYNGFHEAGPNWMIVNWNLIFVAIHSFRIALRIKERLNLDFTPEEEELKETIFKDFAPVEFMKLIRIARWETEAECATLVHEGKVPPRVRLLYSGRVKVVSGEALIAELADGAFVGEMSFTRNRPASATVVALTPCRTVSWDRDELRALLRRNPGMSRLLHAVFAVDLANKLHRKAS